MKNDYSFKLVAMIVLAGVIVAFVSPSQARHTPASAPAEAAPTVYQAE